VYELHIHPNAEVDLDAIWEIDQTTASRIDVFLEEVSENHKYLDALLERHFGKDGSEEFSVDKWVEQWHQKRDLWRAKIWDLEDIGIRYRIIYCYQIADRRFTVLAVVARNKFNYEANSEIGKRIIDDYDSLINE
jgi:mRNA-degrading endonuclease RelE of RelBE toxin-antitoxin system